MSAAGRKTSERLALLNEFIAACLDFAQQQLRTEGRATGMVHLAYGMDSPGVAPDIRQYELTAIGGVHEEEELEKVRAYARRTGAQAVCIVVDLGSEPVAPKLFPDHDGVLIVAAASPDGEIGLMRPYGRTGGGVELGAPRIADGLSISLLEGIF